MKEINTLHPVEGAKSPQIDRLERFRTWRRKQKFATPELSNKAENVERDLRILANMPRDFPMLIEMTTKNIAEFREMLAR